MAYKLPLIIQAFILVIIINSSTFVQGRPRIVGLSYRYQSVQASKTIKLECQVEQDSVAPSQLFYTWTFVPAYVDPRYPGPFDPHNPQPVAINSALYLDPRIKGEDKRTLTISNTHITDNGNYTCRATSPTGQADPVTYSLNVIDPNGPPPQECSLRWNIQGVGFQLQDIPSQEVSLRKRAGEEAYLGCQASGDPEPTIHWYYNNVLQTNYEGSWFVRLTNLSPSKHEGQWRCEVSNGCAHLQTKYYLSVQDMQVSQPQNLTVLVGDTANFECVVKSHVRPTILWLRQLSSGSAPKTGSATEGSAAPVLGAGTGVGGSASGDQKDAGVVAMNGHSYLVLQKADVVATGEDPALNNGMYTFLSKLVIERATLADAGIYVCVANPNTGQDQDYTKKFAALRVLSDPNVPPQATTKRSLAQQGESDRVAAEVQSAMNSLSSSVAAASNGPAGDGVSRFYIFFLVLIPLLALFLIAVALCAYCMKQRRYQKLATARLLNKDKNRQIQVHRRGDTIVSLRSAPLLNGSGSSAIIVSPVANGGSVQNGGLTVNGNPAFNSASNGSVNSANGSAALQSNLGAQNSVSMFPGSQTATYKSGMHGSSYAHKGLLEQSDKQTSSQQGTSFYKMGKPTSGTSMKGASTGLGIDVADTSITNSQNQASNMQAYMHAHAVTYPMEMTNMPPLDTSGSCSSEPQQIGQVPGVFMNGPGPGPGGVQAQGAGVYMPSAQSGSGLTCGASSVNSHPSLPMPAKFTQHPPMPQAYNATLANNAAGQQNTDNGIVNYLPPQPLQNAYSPPHKRRPGPGPAPHFLYPQHSAPNGQNAVRYDPNQHNTMHLSKTQSGHGQPHMSEHAQLHLSPQMAYTGVQYVIGGPMNTNVPDPYTGSNSYSSGSDPYTSIASGSQPSPMGRIIPS